MRIQCQRDVVAGIAAETARMLFSYYFLSVISAPMLLTMACAAVALIYNGILRGMHKETTVLPPANLELALYRGCDLLLSFLAISNVDLTTYVLIQLLIISAVNALEQRMANKKTLWLCLVGFILFVRANELISLLDVAFAISSALLRLETQKLSAQYTKMTIVQADIVSDTLLCLILWLVTPTERDLFMNRVPDQKLLLATAALASLAFIFSRNVLSSTKQSPIITASLICGATSAMLTSSGIPLLIILISLVMVAMAAYNRLDDEPLIDQHYNDIITPRIVQHKNNYATQKLTAVIVVTFALILVHVHSQTLTYENNINQMTMKKPGDEIQLIDFNNRSMSEGVRKQMRLQCLHKTRAMYIKQVSAMIKPNRSFTIFQYPDHWNLGDAFIYYGQTAMWHVYGQLFQRPPNVNDNVNALRLIISRQLDIRNGVLFMTGGGNMGDTYPEADTDRWQLINAIGDDNFLYKAQLVMLPQSINYKSQARLDLAMRGYRHPNLTMMLRDDESVQFAKEKFLINKAVYVPDAAFMLGPLVPNADPVVDLFFLIRQDTESTISNKQTIIGFAKKANLTSEIWDFPVLGFPSAKISDQIVSNVSSMFPDRILYDAKDQSIEAMVAYRTQLGNSMLSRGHVIITDRLHASIMATLIDRPVVYIDNNYRKLTRVRSSLSDHIPECTDAVLNAHYAPNIEEAVKIAATIISKLKNQL